MARSTEHIEVVFADDHQVTRLGLRAMLSTCAGVEVVGEASDGNQAVELVREKVPDLLLVDILMPHKTGIEVLFEVREFNRDVRIVMLTSLEDKLHLTKAMNAGANGYLSKEIGPKELCEAITAVVRGDRVFSSTILELMSRPDSIPYVSDMTTYAMSNVFLSAREQEILTLIAEGMTSKEIADKLFISPRTVETHRKNLMTKLNVKNMAGLVKFALINLP